MVFKKLAVKLSCKGCRSKVDSWKLLYEICFKLLNFPINDEQFEDYILFSSYSAILVSNIAGTALKPHGHTKPFFGSVFQAI